MAHSCQMANHLSQKPLSTPGQAYLSASSLQQQGLIMHAMCLLANESACDKKRNRVPGIWIELCPSKKHVQVPNLVPVSATLFGSGNLQIKPS